MKWGGWGRREGTTGIDRARLKERWDSTAQSKKHRTKAVKNREGDEQKATDGVYNTIIDRTMSEQGMAGPRNPCVKNPGQAITGPRGSENLILATTPDRKRDNALRHMRAATADPNRSFQVETCLTGEFFGTDTRSICWWVFDVVREPGPARFSNPRYLRHYRVSSFVAYEYQPSAMICW